MKKTIEFIGKYWKAIVSALLACFVVAWLAHDRSTPKVGETVVAAPAAELEGNPTETITPKHVQAYKPQAKEQLGLPPEVANDKNKYVLGSAKIPADHHSHLVTPVMDKTTGVVQIFDKTEPSPWAAWDDGGGIGFYFGLKRGVQTARIQVHQELASIKELHFGALANIDQPLNGTAADYFMGVGSEYRW